MVKVLIMKVELGDVNLDEYNYFLKKNSSTFYQYSKHLMFLEKLLKIKSRYVIARENKTIIGIFPFFEKKTKFGNVINSLPFFGSYGGVIASQANVKKEIIEFMNQYNKQNEILSSVIISNPFDSSEVYNKYYKFNEKENRLIQCIKLDGLSIEQLWNNFEQRVRRAIRKAEKNLVIVERPILNKKLFEHFHHLHVKNISSKKGQTKPQSFFYFLKKCFKQGKDYDIFVAKHESKSIAYLLTFYFKSFTEYYMPAYEFEKSDLQATSLLIWKSMKESLGKNAEYYNFGGTNINQKSLYLFKKGWDASDFHYNYFIYGNKIRIKEIGLSNIKDNFKNFYVYPYEKLVQD